ncbi:MAG: hypothetical protein NVS9B10_28470 [Nevskia sp.]
MATVLALALSAPGFAAAPAPLALTPPPAAAPKPVERQFELRMTLTGTQRWKNELQSTEATTAQDYALSTRLRSNGFLYSDNLLDTDQQARLEIKQQYYARQGLLRLKAENGGQLPATVEDVTRLGERYRENSLCKDDFECNNRSIERIAAITAIRSNTRQALEEFLAAPGGADEPRYLYFFGYAGCPTRIHVSYAVHVEGRRAYDKEKKKLVPYSLERKADTPGNDVDRKTLCEKYIATVDTKTGTVYVENLFIPSPPGSSERHIDSSVEKLALDLPPPAELLNWSSAKLRENRDSGHEKVVLPLTTPLDGDRTVQGRFDGQLNLDFSWSFKPVAATPTPAAK